jgi:protein TonB
MIDNIKYPQEAKEKGIQGKVFISFTVNVDGSLTDVIVLKPVNKLLDEEAVRVVKSMPNWIPGKDGNKTIAAQMTLPIDFRLK